MKHRRFEQTVDGKPRVFEVWVSQRSVTTRLSGKGVRAKQTFTTWPTRIAAQAQGRAARDWLGPLWAWPSRTRSSAIFSDVET